VTPVTSLSCVLTALSGDIVITTIDLDATLKVNNYAA